MKKEEQIRMLLHPEKYTDEQLDQMLDETSIPVPDVEEEWQQFKKGHHQRRQPMRWAAILITVAALSGISYAAIQHFQHAREEKQEAGVMPEQKPMAREVVWKKDANITSAVEETDSVRQDQQFNNVALQQIMQQISKDYGVEVVFKNEAPRSIRFYLSWDAGETLSSIVDRINHFEKVHLTLSGETITIN